MGAVVYISRTSVLLIKTRRRPHSREAAIKRARIYNHSVQLHCCLSCVGQVRIFHVQRRPSKQLRAHDVIVPIMYYVYMMAQVFEI